MTLSRNIPVYIGTDGSAPGGQWKRTRTGWRLSESDSDVDSHSPQRIDIENVLEKHVQRQSNKQMLIKAEGIKGAPPSRAGPSENMSYLPLITKTTRESGYTTLGEALRRLNFIEALDDPDKFNYILHIVEFTVKERLLSLSGCAIRRLFGILTKMVELIEQRCNFESRDLIYDILMICENKLSEFKKVLSCSHSAVQCCIDRCEQLRMQLDTLHVPEVSDSANELNLQDMPIEIQDKIMLTLNTLKDFDALSQVAPIFGEIASEYEHIHIDNMINHHWDSAQQRDWKLPIWKSNAPENDAKDLSKNELRSQFTRLSKKHGTRLDYPLVMNYCPKTCVLFWEDSNHPYQASQEQDCSHRVSAREFLTFFDNH